MFIQVCSTYQTTEENCKPVKVFKKYDTHNKQSCSEYKLQSTEFRKIRYLFVYYDFVARGLNCIQFKDSKMTNLDFL